MPRVVVVSPPFSSHAEPLASLAAALRRTGADVHFACAPGFQDLAHRAQVLFETLVVTRNANTGVAESTAQSSRDAQRLADFLESTRRGAVSALLTQAAHRRDDMLPDPGAVLDAMRALHARVRADWYVVDQLSYPVTLALHCLRLPYATLCPGHPSYVLGSDDAFFGMPHSWPSRIRPTSQDLAALQASVKDNDRAFTAAFADVARSSAPGSPSPGRAFALTSSHAVVYSYPHLPWLPARPHGPAHFFAGHMVGLQRPLPARWVDRVTKLRGDGRRLVLVALGTFLSARDDVLRAVARSILESFDDVGVIVAGGGRTAALEDLAGERCLVFPTVPQQALLEQVDAMVHHGGANSFTECLRAGVPAVVLPFSSDQFSVAADAERAGVAAVLDPNSLSERDVPNALRTLWSGRRRPLGIVAAGAVRERGPAWAATQLLEAMSRPQGHHHRTG
ncbi:glycosyltransferase [Streptomyces longispororuber]|uniref:glycosyltransferase n=1 Tax=Streptomyces longispororuber TaxID=68230 RepID=UPI00210E00F7|nr:glycosyltransferase [Streptomyces longispororuber]MCQ4205639.1 glycosyltransferase [Streptomyces longispororuber]